MFERLTEHVWVGHESWCVAWRDTATGSFATPTFLGEEIGHELAAALQAERVENARLYAALGDAPQQNRSIYGLIMAATAVVGWLEELSIRDPRIERAKSLLKDSLSRLAVTEETEPGEVRLRAVDAAPPLHVMIPVMPEEADRG